MKLLCLNGTSCSGKTTIVKNLMKERDNYFHLSYDSFKWQFSKYVSGKYYADIHVIMLSVLEVLCKQKHNVICEAHHPGTRDKLVQMAKDNGYEVVDINLEADWDVLLQRFKERIAHAAANPDVKVANKTPERFKELYDLYEKGKNPNAITLRTDLESIQSTTEKVLALL